MAEIYGFFDGDAEYGQEEFNQYFNAFLRSGVKVEDGGQMGLRVTKASTTNNYSFQVSAGMAILQGFWFKNAQAATLNLTSNSGSSRYARIIVRLTVAEKKVELAVKYGSKATNPTPPALQRSAGIYEISLARILQKGSGAPVLTDERADPDVCGAVRPRETTEYDTLLKAQQERWEEWFESQQSGASVQREIDVQKNRPEGQVAGRIWIKTY